MKFDQIDWAVVQADINNGLSLREIKSKHKIGSSSYTKALRSKLITHIPRKSTADSTKLKIKNALKSRAPRPPNIRPTYADAVCITCNIKKDINEFKFRSTKLNIRSSVCKECDSIRSKAYNSRPDIISRKRKGRITKKEQNKLYINNFLAKNPCVQCGETDIRLLEFDHLVGKKCEINVMKHAYTLNTLIKEIKKCQILCVSCHRLKSSKRRDVLYNIDKKANKLYVDAFLSKGCAKCGVKDINILDCHHIDRDKDFEISHYLHFADLKVIQAELEKCVPLCVKCHKLEHLHDHSNHKESAVADYELVGSDAIVSISKPARTFPIQTVAKRLIFADEWASKRHLFEKHEPLYNLRPQQCTIKLLDNKLVKEFYDRHHYIGHVNSKFNIAVMYDDKIIACMSIRKPSRQRAGEWEISRMARHIDYNIYGVWSYLWKYVVTNRIVVGMVVSYSDKRLHTGNVYEKMGFTKDKQIAQDYYWVKDNVRFHKSSLRKDGQIGITENELRILQGFHKVWDIGKIKWVYQIEE